MADLDVRSKRITEKLEQLDTLETVRLQKIKNMSTAENGEYMEFKNVLVYGWCFNGYCR